MPPNRVKGKEKNLFGGGWHDNYYKIKNTKINARFACGGRESRHYINS